MTREFLKNIKSENRLDKIRLIMKNDDVIGGQPSDDESFTSNTPFLDIACTMKFAIAAASTADGKAVAAQKTADEAKTAAANADKKVKPIVEGGTGASTVVNARKNLGLGSSATLNKTDDFGTSTSLVATQLLVDKLRSELIDATSEPVGKLHFIDDSVVPKGLIEYAGQLIDRVKMPKLFAKYGERMPNYRDRYPRAANGPLGGNPGGVQEDAIRNITGDIEHVCFVGNTNANGALSTASSSDTNYVQTGGSARANRVVFNASKSVPVASENRVKSAFFLVCTKIQ